MSEATIPVTIASRESCTVLASSLQTVGASVRDSLELIVAGLERSSGERNRDGKNALLHIPIPPAVSSCLDGFALKENLAVVVLLVPAIGWLVPIWATAALRSVPC